jgi:hypothetical protein
MAPILRMALERRYMTDNLPIFDDGYIPLAYRDTVTAEDWKLLETLDSKQQYLAWYGERGIPVSPIPAGISELQLRAKDEAFQIFDKLEKGKGLLPFKKYIEKNPPSAECIVYLVYFFAIPNMYEKFSEYNVIS